MVYTIRDLTPGDISSAVRLLEICQGVEGSRPADIAQFVADANANAPIVVAVSGKEIVGILSARISNDDAWIHVVAISPSWRQQGVGSAMIRHLEERLLHAGVRKISALLSNFEAGQTALVNRGFVPTQGLILYEKSEPLEPSTMRVLDEWGGELLDEKLWELVAGMDEEKQLIESRVIAPLVDIELAQRLGVNPPSSVMLFGPPGTGKTTFARAIAGRLGWPFVELLPSKLAGRDENLAAELRNALTELSRLDNIVVFIDEFDEIASTREHNPSTRGVVNELLKMIPSLRTRTGRLLICATNFIANIDPAVLRPGRFDLLIPIGPPDANARQALWSSALKLVSAVDANFDWIVEASEGFTPGDIELAAQRAASTVFDRVRKGGSPDHVTDSDLSAAVSRTPSSITSDILTRFKAEARSFGRV